VLDCAHRLVVWNALVPRLFGVGPEGPLMGRLAGESMLAPWFDPASPLAGLVAEPARFLPALMRALRFEMQAYRSEAWYARMLDDLRTNLPAFRDAWARVERGRASIPPLIRAVRPRRTLPRDLLRAGRCAHPAAMRGLGGRLTRLATGQLVCATRATDLMPKERINGRVISG